MDVARVEFEQLVDLHYAPLYRFALSLAKSESRAADLTQQTFYLWAAKGHQLRDRAKAKSWLFTTLYREFLGAHRHATRFPHVEFDTAVSELPSVEPAVAAAADGATVLDALTTLEEIYRGPLTLFYLEQFSYAQIADVLDIPPGTVMSRLSRGKEALRRKLTEQPRKIAQFVPPAAGARQP